MSKYESGVVADYWTRYNVTAHERFASAAESLAYLGWQNDQYFGYSELMPVHSQDGRGVLDFGCGPPIDRRDPASIASGACRLAEDPALTSRLKFNLEKGRGSWEHKEQQLRQLLEALAGPPLLRPVDLPLSCQQA